MPEDPDREQRDLRLLRQYQQRGDRRAHQRLVERGTPLVRALARPYAGRGEPLEDLVQAGFVGLLGAIERFDPGRRRRFVSFAAPTITGEIKRHFRDHARPVHLPRAVQELEARAARTAADLERRLGRTPAEAEIAAELGVGPAALAEARAATRASWTVPIDGEDEEGAGAAQRVGTGEDGYTAVERRVLLEQAADGLDGRERAVVRMRFVDGLLQREIAARIGVSQVHVSRLLRVALLRMRARLEEVPDAAPPEVHAPPDAEAHHRGDPEADGAALHGRRPASDAGTRAVRAPAGRAVEEARS